MHEHAPDFGDSALGSGIDLLKIRNDTPGCLDKVFLDGAGSALPPRVVVEAVIEHLEYEAQVGGYAAMNDRQTEFDEIYSVLGTLVNCAPHQVALTGSATAAWLRAVTSIPLHEGDTVLVTGDEYASNVIPLIQSARRAGAAVEFLPAGAEGTVDLAVLADLLDTPERRVRVVALTHAASQNGLIIDAAAVGRLIDQCPQRPWYLLDACQSVGQIPVDMEKIKCDFLSATGRKFLRGPRGTGFLAVSRRVLDELEAFPGDMFGSQWNGLFGVAASPTAARFQSFELPYANFFGLLAAVRYALDLGIAETERAIRSRAEWLRCALSEARGVKVLDKGLRPGGIVVCAVGEGDSVVDARELRERGVTVAPVTVDVNPRAWAEFLEVYPGRVNRLSVLRASPHVYNDGADLASAVEALSELASHPR